MIVNFQTPYSQEKRKNVLTVTRLDCNVNFNSVWKSEKEHFSEYPA